MKRLFTLLIVALFAFISAQGQSVGDFRSKSTGPANWNDTAAWQRYNGTAWLAATAGQLPSSTSAVEIRYGQTIKINATALTSGILTVRGILVYDTLTVSALTVTGNVKVDTGAVFKSPVGGTITTHALSIAGDLQVNGTFNMNIFTSAAVAVTFTGVANDSIYGTSTTINFYSITVNKGTTTASILEVSRSTIITIVPPSVAGMHLTITNGTFKLSSASTLTPYMGTQYLVASTGRLWLNNAGATVQNVGVGTSSGTGRAFFNTGTLQITAGTFSYGSGSDVHSFGNSAPTLILEGPNATFNVYGSLQIAYSTNFLMSAGNINIYPQAGNNLTSYYPLSIESYFLITTNIQFTGGTITIVDPPASGTYASISSSLSNGTFNLAGGTIRLGNGVSDKTGGTNGFTIAASGVPLGNLVVNNNPSSTSTTRYAKLSGATLIGGNLTINSGAANKFFLNGYALTLGGNLTNSGTFNGDGSAANSLVLNGTAQQTISGTGSFTNINNITINNTSATSPAVNLQDSLSVSNSLTLTSGSLGTTTTGVFTIGKSASSATLNITRSGGSLTLTPVYSFTGVTLNSLTYNAPAVAANITTGAELPPSIPITTLTINNATGVTLNKAASCTTLALTAGILTTTSTNLVTVTGTALTNITGGSATAYVSGPLARTIPSGLTGSTNYYKYPVGKTGYWLFEFSNITTGGTGNAVISVEAFDAGPYSGFAGYGMATVSTDKYWRMSGSLGTATITSSKIRINDPGVGATNNLGQSNTVSGTFASIGGVLGTGTLSSFKTIDYSNLSSGTYFRIGTKGGIFPAGNYAIGPSGPYAGYSLTFATFQNAIDAATDIGLGGNIIFEFQSDYNPSVETYPITMLSLLSGSPTSTITFRPASTVISAISFTNAGTVLSMNGCDYVTLDGHNHGTGTNKFLQFTNSTTTGQTIDLSNDATFDNLRYCVIKGSNTTTSSGILLINAGVTTGNDNALIDHCNFDGAGAASNCIYSTGSATAVNDNITISNNNFFDFRAVTSNAGIYAASYSNAWTIDSNSFYQSASYNGVAGTSYGIYISGGTGNSYLIFNNYIGGIGPLGSGTWTVSATTPAAFNFTGMYLNLGTTTLSKIYKNKINGFDWKSTPGTWTAINLAGGSANVGTDGANQIGSNTGNDSIKVTYYTTASTANVYGIMTSGTGTTRIENNKIGALTTLLNGITNIGTSITAINAGNTNCTVRKNIIGSTVTAQSINAANQSTTGYTQNVIGINCSSAGIVTINGNTIANLFDGITIASASAGINRGIKISSSGTTFVVDSNLIYSISTPQAMTGTSTTGNIAGIDIQATSATSITISGNTIYEMVNTATTGAVNVNGIFYYGSLATINKIDKNLIVGLKTASATAIQNGLYIAYGLGTFQNNLIRLGIDKDGNAITSTAQINGIYKTSSSAGNCNFYFNTIYIGGSGVVAGTVNCYAFNLSTHSTEDIRNNIFVNARTNAVANLLNYALSLPTGLTTNYTSDYNIYKVSSTDGKLSKINAADVLTMQALREAISGSDLHSGMGDPLLTLPANALSTMNLKISNTSPAEGTGIAITGIDKDYIDTTRSTHTPTDIGAYAGNFTAPVAGQDIFNPVITYTPLTNTGTLTGRVLTSFATITDQVTGVNVTTGTKPRIYYKKSTDANAFAGNTSGNNGWKWVEATNSTSPFSFTIDYTIINGGSVSLGTVIQYFVVAQDQATTPNVSFNPLAGSAGTSVATTGMTTPTTPFSYTIVSAIPTTISVGTGQTYTTLTGASATNSLFAAINAGVLTGNTIVTIISDITEPATTALNQWAEDGVGGYTLTIQPDGTLRTLSGSTGATTTPLIDFNGADRVIMDGGTSKLLTIRNTNATSTLTGPVIRFTNGSVSCTVNRCIIESNSTSYTTVGSITTGGPTANSVTISNCEIRDARGGTTGYPSVGIFSSANPNVLTITNNNIYNWKGTPTYNNSYGIYLQTPGDGCTITGNSFYMESASVPASMQTAIWVSGGNSHVISNNFIGGQSPVCAGSAWTNSGNYTITGMSLHFGAITASTVQGNTIQNINLTGGTSVFYGLYTEGLQITTANMIGSATVANSIQFAGTGASAGIYVVSATLTSNYEQNTIANVTMTAASGSPNFTAIRLVGGNARRNKIFSDGASVSTTTPVIYGIYNTGGTGANEFSNNMISINGGSSTNPTLYGFYESSSTPTISFYYNSINIYGTASGAATTYAFIRTAASSYTLKDNILVNSRTGGTGKNYAIYSTPTTVFVSNYNDLYVAGAVLGNWGGTDMANLAAWQAVVITPKLDSNSISTLPTFTSATDLHIVSDANIANKGTAVSVTIDIDGLTRCTIPDMGINQFGTCASFRTLNLTVFLQSLYSTGSTMRQAQGSTGNQYSGTTADQITVELHNSTTYATLVYSVANVNLSTAGLAVVSIPLTYGSSYYVTVKNRNSITTVSAAPISFAGTTINYNFTSAATQAFGSNLKLLNTGLYGIYGGDANGDGAVDGLDMIAVENAAILFSGGYIATDLNGDGVVDGLDLILAENNTLGFISTLNP